MRRALLPLLLLTSLSTAAPPAAPAAPAAAPAPVRDGTLQKRLEALAKGHRGKVSFFARHLITGKEVALHADRPMRTASVIKLALFLEAFNQVKAGKRTLKDAVVLDRGNQVLGSGVLGMLQPGLKLTLDDALVLMMVLSDNTATNLLVDFVGLDATNQNTQQRMGLPNTHLYKKIQVPATHAMPPDQKQFGLGKTTAREAAAMMEWIARCELKHAALCRRMLEILIGQGHRDMAPRFVETLDWTEVPSAVGGKTGSLNATRNDVELFFTSTGPVVVSAFTTDNEDQRWSCENEAVLLIARLAEAVIKAWAPKGLEQNGPPPLHPDAGTPSYWR